MLIKTERLFSNVNPENFVASVAKFPAGPTLTLREYYALYINGVQASREYPIPEPATYMLETLKILTDEWMTKYDGVELEEDEMPDIVKLNDVICVPIPSIIQINGNNYSTSEKLERYATFIIGMIKYYVSNGTINSLDYEIDNMVLEMTVIDSHGHLKEYILYCCELPGDDPSPAKWPMPISVIKHFKTPTVGTASTNNPKIYIDFDKTDRDAVTLAGAKSYGSYKALEREFYNQYFNNNGVSSTAKTVFNNAFIKSMMKI